MSPTPTTSKACQAFFHIVKANPLTLKPSEDSNIKLRTPNLQSSISPLIINFYILNYTANHVDELVQTLR